MSRKSTINYVKLGIFVTAGLLLLVIALYFIGSKKNLFGDTFSLYVNFKDINGLKKGNNIRYGGIDVGTVGKITIINDTTIKVELVLEERMKTMIRKNSVANIGTDGLMGDKLVNIDAGSSASQNVTDDDYILSRESVNTDEMLRTLQFTNNNVAIVSANLKTLTETINKSKGTLYTIMMDTSLSVQITRALSNIEAASSHINSFGQDLSVAGEDLQQGKGFLGALLKDTALSGDFKNSMTNIKNSGEQLSAATKNLQDILEKVNHGSGPLNTLINDTGADASLKNAIQNIDSSSVKLNENLEALKHSWLLRRYFKKQEKKK